MNYRKNFFIAIEVLGRNMEEILNCTRKYFGGQVTGSIFLSIWWQAGLVGLILKKILVEDEVPCNIHVQTEMDKLLLNISRS